jgi:hypothetical protein
MAIPESQFDTWSNQGSITNSRRTHESIRVAIDEHEWPDNIDFEIYLQGSYKNDTNIRGDSDVDIVVQLNSAFFSNLTEEQKRILGFGKASYRWREFKEDVLTALINYYGRENIRNGNKAINVTTPYLLADVVACIQYRQYRSLVIDDFIEGMKFYISNESRWVINYPKIHYDNGVRKNSGTNGWYKPSVRVFKNIRSYLVNKGRLPSHLVPSYFLECLLYNVSNYNFGTSYQATFCNLLNWLIDADFSRFVCQNEQLSLFGNSPEQWTEDHARRLLLVLSNLWHDWET